MKGTLIKRLLLFILFFIGLKYLLDISPFNRLNSNLFGVIFFTVNGFFFGLSIVLTLKTSLVRSVLFVLLSMACSSIAVLTVLSLAEGYIPHPSAFGLTLGATIGTLLEVITFTFIYKTKSHLKRQHLFATAAVGVLFALLFLGYSILHPTANSYLKSIYWNFTILIWQFTTALILYDLYKRK